MHDFAIKIKAKQIEGFDSSTIISLLEQLRKEKSFQEVINQENRLCFIRSS